MIISVGVSAVLPDLIYPRFFGMPRFRCSWRSIAPFDHSSFDIPPFSTGTLTMFGNYDEVIMGPLSFGAESMLYICLISDLGDIGPDLELTDASAR